MLKKILILLLSVNVLSAVQNSSIEEDLTPRQKAFVRCSLLVDSLVLGATFGSVAVSYLPERSPFAVKAAIFAPIAFYFTAMMSSNSQEKIMMDFCKKHRWLLLGL